MIKIKLLYKKINYNDLALISGNIAMLYKEGISMLMIMDLLNELPISKGYKESINKSKDYILEGKSLEECFKIFDDLYPDFFIGMVSMGEKSGNLYKVLKGLEEYCNKITFINTTIKNVLSYPLLIIISSICLFAFIVLFTIPILYDFFNSLGGNVPFICKLSYDLSNYIKEHPIIFIVYIANYFILLPWFLCKYYLKDRLRLLINKITIYKDFIEYTFILLLSIILRSGVNLSEGLIYASNSFKNKDLKERFCYLNSGILNGDAISITLGNTGNYSKYTISIIKLGEEGGAIDERLDSLSSYLEKKLISKINRGIALLQPASVIFMGGFVIIFLIIFILPLFSAMFEVGF
ncbi:type II secretion system F family protein [Clostridium sp. AL.422]|uniref:type II secretion system F family protein n=1 Tax=Clostridium TaxID=1485 RepID=UPI00293DEFC5|nr:MULTISPECIES: type II secretion system F family protein [unclassified Clostridium]MDV4152541.1 type II secretion system F family protein [Clostridium sp. AL.422]